MGKRKGVNKQEEKRKKAKQSQDAELQGGVFAHHGHSSDSETEHSTHFNDDNDDGEMDYELKPRMLAHAEDDQVEGLPIKRADGRIERVTRKIVAPEPTVESDDEVLPPPQPVTVGSDAVDGEVDPDESLTPQERLLKLKEEVADLALKLIENPEENYACLTRLRKMSESRNIVTSQVAIMALLPVFKSLAPAYKIRPLTDVEKREKVGREIASLRRYEQSLVNNYCLYVKHLAKLAKVSFSNSQNNRRAVSSDVSLGMLATTVACDMCLSSLRHFNARQDLFAIVVRRLNKKPQNQQDHKVFVKCVSVLETLFQEDAENGDVTFDLLHILCKSISDKKYRVDELVLNVCLSMTLLQDYDPNHNRDVDPKLKIKKKNRVHLSKKERKNRKERKEIDEEMRVAEQAITVEQREKFQASVLKMLLRMYLEILRAGLVRGNNADAGNLMAAVLEGLSRFGQMANFDLLGDFLQVLREIMTDTMEDHALVDAFSTTLAEASAGLDEDADEDEGTGGLYTSVQLRTILLCIATSFALVFNHSSTGKLPMAIDFTVFVSSLYTILSDLCLECDLEFSHKTLRLADPLAHSEILIKPSVNVSTTAELWLRCMDFVFFRSKNGTAPRAAAFTKRLFMLVLNTPEKTSLACLKFIGKLTSRYDESLKGLWNTEERISGEGSYALGIETLREVELERCNSGAATLWESVLLDKHYCPMVRDGLRSLMKNSKNGRT